MLVRREECRVRHKRARMTRGSEKKATEMGPSATYSMHVPLVEKGGCRKSALETGPSNKASLVVLLAVRAPD